MPDAPSVAAERELVNDITSFQHDPFGFVRYAFPWGKGELQDSTGPREWQKKFLIELGEDLKAGKINASQAIQKAVASGHGTGKSVLVAWLILWGLSTMEDTRGVVTANTDTQLKTKTWAELAKWHRISINAHWFTFTATALYSSDAKHERTWRIDAIPWSESNTEAFAGLHNKGKRVIAIFDEASAIADKIWEVMEGALTDEDTEIVWCVFGNPTRNVGRFRECFGRLRHRWSKGSPLQIDSRTVEGTNKTQLQSWVDDYGEDSDFVRVRVRGLFPMASSLQLFPSDLVSAAMKRDAIYNMGDALIMALDIARGGDDNCVFRFRRGLDAMSIPPVRIPGSEARDSMKLAAKAADLIAHHKPDAFFYDGTGVGGPVGDRIRQLGYNVIEVQFGSASPDERYANMRAYMYMKLRDALQAGLAIDDSPALEQDLTSLEYTHNKRDQIILESKEHMKSRGLASPDDADALAMTYAYPVAPVQGLGASDPSNQRMAYDYDPFEERT